MFLQALHCAWLNADKSWSVHYRITKLGPEVKIPKIDLDIQSQI